MISQSEGSYNKPIRRPQPLVTQINALGHHLWLGRITPSSVLVTDPTSTPSRAFTNGLTYCRGGLRGGDSRKITRGHERDILREGCTWHTPPTFQTWSSRQSLQPSPATFRWKSWACMKMICDCQAQVQILMSLSKNSHVQTKSLKRGLNYGWYWNQMVQKTETEEWEYDMSQNFSVAPSIRSQKSRNLGFLINCLLGQLTE